MKVYVLVDQEHEVFGVYQNKDAAESAIYNSLRGEGIPEDDLECYADDWIVVGPLEVEGEDE